MLLHAARVSSSEINIQLRVVIEQYTIQALKKGKSALIFPFKGVCICK
jgi:hypothetical protein